MQKLAQRGHIKVLQRIMAEEHKHTNTRYDTCQLTLPLLSLTAMVRFPLSFNDYSVILRRF